MFIKSAVDSCRLTLFYPYPDFRFHLLRLFDHNL
jgi:hypothetical protein